MTDPTPQFTLIEGEGSRKTGLTLFELLVQQRERVAEEQAKYDQLAEEARIMYGPGKYTDGDAIVEVQETYVLDKGKAARLFPGEEYQELTYTAASLKRRLTGDQYREVQTRGKDKVIAKRKSDS